jgi:hypothetical protein
MGAHTLPTGGLRDNEFMKSFLGASSNERVNGRISCQYNFWESIKKGLDLIFRA